MRVNEIPQLRFPQHQVACQGSITAFMVQPDTAVDRQRRNNSGRIRADGPIKPVIRVSQMETVTVRHHVAAALRNTDEMPEASAVIGDVFLSERIDLHLSGQKIVTKQIRQERETVGLPLHSAWFDGHDT